MRLPRAFALLWLAAAAVGCGSHAHAHAPRVEDYQRSCTKSTDCTMVYLGAEGCCGQCPNAVISTSEVLRANNDVGAAMNCESVTSCSAQPPCPTRTPACVQGTCQFWQPPTQLSLSNYDRSCTSVTDCAAAFFTEHPTCCDFPCLNAAVRTSALDSLQTDIRGSTMCPSPPSCEAPAECPVGRILCEAGLCQFVSSQRDAGVNDAETDQ
jgi:hypothetical protein